jgi:hypothetical protein
MVESQAEIEFQLTITVISVFGHLRDFFGNSKVFQRNYRYERGSKVGVPYWNFVHRMFFEQN